MSDDLRTIRILQNKLEAMMFDLSHIEKLKKGLVMGKEYDYDKDIRGLNKEIKTTRADLISLVGKEDEEKA